MGKSITECGTRPHSVPIASRILTKPVAPTLLVCPAPSTAGDSETRQSASARSSFDESDFCLMRPAGSERDHLLIVPSIKRAPGV